MSLKDELSFSKPMELPAHEAVLNIYYTASCLKKKADELYPDSLKGFLSIPVFGVFWYYSIVLIRIPRILLLVNCCTISYSLLSFSFSCEANSAEPEIIR